MAGSVLVIDGESYCTFPKEPKIVSVPPGLHTLAWYDQGRQSLPFKIEFKPNETRYIKILLSIPGHYIEEATATEYGESVKLHKPRW
jgi:hypothetical protein